MTAPVRREVVRAMVTRGLSERHALTVVGMSASARYTPRTDRNAALRDRIVALPKALRTDNGPEFCSRAMLTWAHQRGVDLRLIEPGKPNQNAYIESFNRRFRDE